MVTVVVVMVLVDLEGGGGSGLEGALISLLGSPAGPRINAPGLGEQTGPFSVFLQNIL